MSTRARAPLIDRGSPSAGPAVRRAGQTALMVAARNDDRATVAALLGARADVNAEQISGCAFPARSARVGGGRRCADAAVPAPSGRWTALHYAAHYGFIGAAAELLVGGADQCIMNDQGYAVPPTATQRPHANRCRRTPRQLAQARNKLGEYDAAVAQARPPHARAPPALRASHSQRHRGARHAGAARHAEAAFFGVRRHTRGMTCASRCVQSFAAIGRQQAVRAHTALPPTVHGGATQAALTGTWLATHCEFGFASALT